MRFITVLFIFFISTTCESQTKFSALEFPVTQDVDLLTNQLHLRWKEFYVPSKNCRNVNNIQDSKKRSRCKVYERKARYKFDALNEKEIAVIELLLEERASRRNEPSKPSTISAPRQVKQKEAGKTPEYISFKYGGSACPNIKYWKGLIDKEFDRNCFSLREGNIVFGVLDRYIYNGNEYIQVKSSDGRLLWLEVNGVGNIQSRTFKKPNGWSSNLRTQDGRLVNRKASNDTVYKSSKKPTVNTVDYGVRTKGGGIACLSEDWYKEVISNTNIDIFNAHIKSKKCIILKKGLPITLLDSTIFTRRAEFLFMGVKFWSSMENIIME